MSILMLLISLLFAPEFVSAQDLAGAAGCDGPTCTACNVVSLANAVINWLIAFLTLVFAVIAVIAGFGLVSSAGNQSALDAAKSKFTNAIIGFIIILSAWLVVDTIFRGLVSSDGIVPNASRSGGLFWGEIECQEIRTPQDAVVQYITLNEAASEDSDAARAPAVDASGSPVSGSQSIPSGIVVNEAMNPIFETSQGGSSMVRPGADARMQATLEGPFARLQQIFGRPVMINDAIARAGSSRETNTTGSRHFYGDALDLSIRGMSPADQIRLFDAARQAGFTGFGFGGTILHVDLGPSRGWSYGNSTYGGRNVRDLINSI